MTNTENINTMKSKIAFSLIGFFLALMAAAVLQSAALAETFSTPSSSRDSIAAGAPKYKTASKPGEAIKDKGGQQTQEGSLQTKGAFISTSGTPGAIYWSPIYGQGYYYGANLLSWNGSGIDRSTSYSGTQVITETHKIYKWNTYTGQWENWTNVTSSSSVPAGYHAQLLGGNFRYASSNQEHYFVDIVVTWKTTGGSLIAKRTIRTTNRTDYGCVFSSGLCSTNGTEGSLVWISLLR